MLKILILLIFLPTVVLSKTIEEIIEREDAIPRLPEIKKEEIKKRIERNYIKNVHMQDIISSGTYKGLIKKDSPIFNLDSTERIELTKDIYVHAFRKEDHEGMIYLKNKDDKVLYKTYAYYVANVEEVSDLYKPPHYYVPLEKKIEIDPFDKKPKLTFETHFIPGISLSNVTRDLADQDNSPLGSSFRIEACSYFNFPLPVTLGLFMNYEKLTINSQKVESSQELITLGPGIKTKNFDNYYAGLETRFSLQGNFNSKNDQGVSKEAKLYSTSLEGFIIKENGPFLLGARIQREWIRAKSVKSNLNIKSQNTYNDSLAVSLGWRWL